MVLVTLIPGAMSRYSRSDSDRPKSGLPTLTESVVVSVREPEVPVIVYRFTLSAGELRQPKTVSERRSPCYPGIHRSTPSLIAPIA